MVYSDVEKLNPNQQVSALMQAKNEIEESVIETDHSGFLQVEGDPKLGKPNLFHWPGHAYAGPGTDLNYQLENNVDPQDFDDYVAFRHDFDYAVSKSYEDRIKADDDFINALKYASKDGKNSHTGILMTGVKMAKAYNKMQSKMGFKLVAENVDVEKFKKIRERIENAHPNWFYDAELNKAENLIHYKPRIKNFRPRDIIDDL